MTTIACVILPSMTTTPRRDPRHPEPHDDGARQKIELARLLDEHATARARIVELERERDEARGHHEDYRRVMALADGARLDSEWQELVRERDAARARAVELERALLTLAKFAREAPGRPPVRVQDALAIADAIEARRGSA